MFRVINLRLFDGEAASASPAGATGEQNGEQKAVNSRGSKNPLADVKYGVQASGTASATEGNANETAVSDTAQDTTQAADTKPSFDELIKGEYKDEFTKRINSIMGQRTKEMRSLQAEKEKLMPILGYLYSKYDVSEGDTDALMNAVQADDSYFEAEAEKRGMDIPSYKQMRKMSLMMEQSRRSEADIRSRLEWQNKFIGWQAQAEQLKSKYPGLDLKTEMSNPEFVKMLNAGVSVQAAYQAQHMDEIMNSFGQSVAQSVATKQAQNIAVKQHRPVENGSFAQAGVIIKADVSKLSKADRAEIARRSARGEEIRF